MGITLFNTLGNRKEEFHPIREKEVRMYVCGVTVYDLCHLGHARANLVFDFIYRYFLHLGYKVTYVRNFTDIDDKIITRAREEGVSYKDISERYIGAFTEDMNRLGLLPPTVEPKATDHIGEIIGIVNSLEERGHAYEIDGDVYFAVDSFLEYGKLSGRKLEDLAAGARVEVDSRKNNPMDFALWKRSKEGEPSWDSPWGPGRPGWHIECSAMSMKHLGESFDIHGGGKDLVFPHHENEVAQSECISGHFLARYWLHNGFVNINREKMSKSLGNFFTIREVLEKYHPEVLRFLFASTHYRSPIDFSDTSVREAKAGLDRLYNFYERVLHLKNKGISEREISSLTIFLEEEGASNLPYLSDTFEGAMNDDFNTAAALGQIFEAVRTLNRIYPDDSSLESERGAAFVTFGNLVVRLGKSLGFFSENPESYFRYAIEDSLKKMGVGLDGILEKVREREEARRGKDYGTADLIRNELEKLGIILEDTQYGTFWKFDEDDAEQ